MRRNLIAAALAFATLAVAATDDYTSQVWKDEIARGYLPYRKLTYQDFPAFDNTTSKHAMYTMGFIHYNFNAKWKETGRGATATLTDFTVRSGFDRNTSWRRSFTKNDAALIAHEQGHLDINELYAQKVRGLKDVTEAKGIDYQEAMEKLRTQIRAAVDAIVKDMQTEQQRYDSETLHGRDYVRQAAWADSLRQRLDSAKIKYWDE